MELRAYLGVLARRYLVVIGVIVVTLATLLVSRPQAQTTYEAQFGVAVKARSESTQSQYYSAEYYDYLSAEFLLDDIKATVGTNAFQSDVKQRLAAKGSNAEGSFSATTTHRVLTVKVSSASEQAALDMALASAEMLTEKDSKYVSLLTSRGSEMSLIQPAFVSGVSNGSKVLLDVVLRLALGLIGGVVLAFLVDYLDVRVRDSDETERLLGLAVLGEIPKR